MKKKLLALGLTLALALGLTACASNTDSQESTPPAETTPASETTSQNSETPALEGTDINLGLLNGPTGMGAAKLLADNDAG